jgi:hypothetical protein
MNFRVAPVEFPCSRKSPFPRLQASPLPQNYCLSSLRDYPLETLHSNPEQWTKVCFLVLITMTINAELMAITAICILQAWVRLQDRDTIWMIGFNLGFYQMSGG